MLGSDHYSGPRILSREKSRAEFGNQLKNAARSTTAKRNEINVDGFGAKGDGSDDTEAFLRAWNKACSSVSDQIAFNVPARKVYNLKPVTFAGPCKSDIVVNIYGTISGSKNLADYKYNFTRYWLIFENITDLTVQGGGTIDGNGQVWWPKHCKIDNSRPCENGAKALSFKRCNNLLLHHLNLVNPQQMHIHLEDCINVGVSNLVMNAPGDSPNTDGIHVLGSRNVSIKNCDIRTGDDCISIIAGTHQIKVTNITCGPGHGISIGSLGKEGANDAVSDILVKNATLTGTDNGVRIKSWQGGKGLAMNITFDDIIMEDVKNPIVVDQFYCDQKGECPEQKEAVRIKDVVYRDIIGTSATQMGMSFKCSSSIPCEGIQLENVELTYNGGDILASCSNANVLRKGTVSPTCP